MKISVYTYFSSLIADITPLLLPNFQQKFHFVPKFRLRITLVNIEDMASVHLCQQQELHVKRRAAEENKMVKEN